MRMRLLLVLMVTTSVVSAAGQAGLQPCTLEGLDEPVLCGTLEVAENRGAPTGRKISLRVAVLKAKADTPAPDPLFILQGGPGQSAVKLAEFYGTSFPGIRAHRDIVLVDQRGTGGSHPLKCDFTDPSIGPQGYLGDLFPVEGVRRCRKTLEETSDLAMYTTSVAMDDLDEVRVWLGYEKINLYGTSYGTTAAQVYLQRHGERVRSAILKAVVPLNERVMVTSIADSQKALDATFKACEADPACAKKYPDIRKHFGTILQQLDKQPATASVQDPAGKQVEVKLSRGALGVTLRGMLHSPGSANQLLPMIQEASKGNFAPLAQTSVMIRKRYPEELSFGMFLSVICAEETPFIDRDDAVRMTEGTFMGMYWTDQLLQACGEWPRGTPPQAVRNPLSTAPVLLVSGGLDPVTPPHLGDRAADYLPNSRHLVVPNGGHPFAGLAGCVDVLMAEFLERGSAKDLDFSCAEKVARPPFVLEP